MRIFDKYPRPWVVEQDESVDPDRYKGGFTVFDAKGQTIIFGGTYTGDGDEEFNLDRLQVGELVKIINAA